MASSIVDIRILQREYLLAITRALTAELDISDLLRLILQSSVELVSGKAGLIALKDPTTEQLSVVAVHGIPAPVVDHFAPLLRELPATEGADQEAELTKRLKIVARNANMGLTQMIRLPMISGNDIIGTIYVFMAGQYFMIEDASALLRSFAEQAAIAVKNARLYQQINNEKRRLNAIIEQNADGVMILDPALRIKEFNKALSLMTGWRAEDAIGKLHSDVLQWQKLKTDMDLYQALASGWPLPGAAHLYVEGDFLRPENSRHQTADGQAISLGITYAPLMDPDGKMTDIIANVRDLTRYREEEALQKTFISVVSHELKTPVSIIKGYAGTLQRQDANWSPEVIQESLLVIEEEADNLTDLIDSLLEVSRLQAGTFNLEIGENVLLPAMVQRTVRKFSSQTDKHTFSIEFPDDFPAVTGDERRLNQVLNNLMSNALKYSPDGGEIKLYGAEHSAYVTLSIQDAGIGIPEHEQPRIFQKFSRLDNALSRKTEGTGLGLFLSKSIIEAHNGRIWFSSNQDAPGTTFTFSLPKDREDSEK